jgi:hypothetical protein
MATAAQQSRSMILSKRIHIYWPLTRGMVLSRGTVQTYISRILTKLGAKGRVEIVREALRHGVSP